MSRLFIFFFLGVLVGALCVIRFSHQLPSTNENTRQLRKKLKPTLPVLIVDAAMNITKTTPTKTPTTKTPTIKKPTTKKSTSKKTIIKKVIRKVIQKDMKHQQKIVSFPDSISLGYKAKIGAVYISLIEWRNKYYAIVKHRGDNIILYSDNFKTFTKIHKFSDYWVKPCLNQDIIFFKDNQDKLYLYGGNSANIPEKKKIFGEFCDGHYLSSFNINTFTSSKPKITTHGGAGWYHSFDTLPSLLQVKDRYIVYTRQNMKAGDRRVRRYESNSLHNFHEYVTLTFPYYVYLVNVVYYNNKYHGFFWSYKTKEGISKDLYKKMFIVYATSVDGIDFQIVNHNMFPKSKSMIPVNGILGNNTVFFYDYKNGIMKKWIIKEIKQTPIKQTPVKQTPKTLLHFVIPFRDRHAHFDEMKIHLQKLRQKFNIKVFLIEQDNKEHFNRGWLLNVGIKQSLLEEEKPACIISSDVDIFGNVDYAWCDKPTHICSEMSCHGNSVPYKTNAGGVVTATPNHWEDINGYTNNGVGWGGEDDDLHHRFRQAKLLQNGALRRPKKGKGKCKCLHDDNHTKRKINRPTYNKIIKQIQRVARGSKEWKKDGLNTLKYYVKNKEIIDNWVYWYKVHDKSIVTPEFSVGIKTMNRLSKTINQIDSIQKFYPDVPIYVVDDGKLDHSKHYNEKKYFIKK